MNDVLKLPPAMRILRVAAPPVGKEMFAADGSFLAARLAAPNADETTKFLRSMWQGLRGDKRVWSAAIVASWRALGKGRSGRVPPTLDTQPNSCILTADGRGLQSTR